MGPQDENVGPYDFPPENCPPNQETIVVRSSHIGKQLFFFRFIAVENDNPLDHRQEFRIKLLS